MFTRLRRRAPGWTNQGGRLTAGHVTDQILVFLAEALARVIAHTEETCADHRIHEQLPREVVHYRRDGVVSPKTLIRGLLAEWRPASVPARPASLLARGALHRDLDLPRSLDLLETSTEDAPLSPALPTAVRPVIPVISFDVQSARHSRVGALRDSCASS